jgi:chaperonin cofactor prefoldin
MTAHFDPLDYAQQLETAGVPKAQAEVHARTLAHVVDDCVAVPADLGVLKRELTHLISETETRLRAEISKVESRLRAEIQELEARLNSKLEIMEARLNTRIDELKAELRFHRWVSGITLAFVMAIFAKSMLA